MKKRLFTSIFLALMALFALPVEVWGDTKPTGQYDQFFYVEFDKTKTGNDCTKDLTGGTFTALLNGTDSKTAGDYANVDGNGWRFANNLDITLVIQLTGRTFKAGDKISIYASAAGGQDNSKLDRGLVLCKSDGTSFADLTFQSGYTANNFVTFDYIVKTNDAIIDETTLYIKRRTHTGGSNAVNKFVNKISISCAKELEAQGNKTWDLVSILSDNNSETATYTLSNSISYDNLFFAENTQINKFQSNPNQFDVRFQESHSVNKNLDLTKMTTGLVFKLASGARAVTVSYSGTEPSIYKKEGDSAPVLISPTLDTNSSPRTAKFSTNSNEDILISLVPKGSGNCEITKIEVTPKYTLIYDGSGNTSGSVPTDSNSPYASGSTVTVLGNTGSLAKTGYTFSGWNTSADGTGTDYAVDATFNISENTTLYAKWTVNKAAGSISYAKTEITKTVGDAVFTNELTIVGDGTVTYSITDDGTGTTINASTGEVTVGSTAGTATITATVANGTNYDYATTTATYTLTVNAKPDEDAISTMKTWTFDNYNVGDYYVSNSNSYKAVDGLYARSLSGRNFVITESTLNYTFSDGTSGSVTKYAKISGTYSGSNSAVTSAAQNSGYLTPFFAFNTTVAGTCYAYVKSSGENNQNVRIYYTSGNGSFDCPSGAYTTSYTAREIKLKASAGGSFFIGSTTNAVGEIYAIRFVPTHTLTSEVDPTGKATITMKDGSTAVDSGTSIEEGKTITIEVSGIANGYEIDHVKVNDGDAMTATNGKYSFTMPTADATVKVTLKKKSYTLTAATVDNGSISFTVSGAAATTAEFGDEVTIISNPNANYQLSTLTGTYGTELTALSIIDNKFTMPDGDVTITATFVSTAVVPTTSDYGTFTFTGLGDSNGIVPNWGATLSSGTLQMLAKGNETFGNRFAAGPVDQNSSNNYNCFKFKSDSEWDGLYSQYDNRTFSIINLKTNDQVTITMKDNRANLKFVDGNAVENGKAYLVDADGDYNFVTTGETYIQSVKVVKTFNISILSLTNGSITADKERASAGETVTLTVTLEEGYQLKEGSLKATYNDGSQNQEITITDNKFTMPGYDVTIKAEFEKPETVTAPSCEAATEGKVTTGTVTITPATTDDSAATMTTYYATSLTSAAPATDVTDAWTVLPENKTITMEKSGYIFLYGKSSTGITTSVATIDVELPVYGKYNFGDIAGTYYNNTSTSKSASFENGELKVESTLFGLNRAFSGTNWNLRYSDATYKGLQTSSGTSTMTISRLNQYDIVKIKHNNTITASSGNVTLLGSTKENEKVGEITYVINSGNSIELSGTGAWIYSVEISNEDAVSAPTITVDGNNQVTIDGGTSLQGKAVTVYYTTDGSNPTTSSTQYSSPFTAEKTVYIKAFSVVTENTNIQSPVAEKKVSVGTYTATKNVFDFAALAGDFGEFSFGETAVSLNEYWSTSVTNEDKDFYEITNTDHFTATDNTVKVLMRGKTGNTLSYTNGGMTGSNSGLIAITGLTIGQRVIVEYLNGGSVRYNTGAEKGDVTINGTTLERGATIASGAVMTVTNGDYMVLYNVANSTITKISVLDAVATYSVTVPTSTEHGQVVADKTTAGEGETVTLTVTLDAGYVVESLTVKDANNGDVTVTTVAANSSYTFVMPAKAVTITVAFTQYVEKTVNSVTNWTFDGLSGTCNEIKEVDGAYLRGSASNPTRTFTVTDINEQTLTFADGTSVTVNKYLAVNNSMYPLAFTETSTAASTATKTNNNNVEELIGAGSFAVNTTVPGTIYAKLSTESDQNVRIYCTDAISSPQTFALKAADGIQEVTYTTTAENGGTFFVGGVKSKYNIYAVRFVPTSQAVTYTLTVGSVENGTITAKIGDTTVAEGESAQVIPGSTVTLTAVPADGYQLSGWKNGSNDLGAIPQSIVTTAAMPATALTVSAAFEQQPSSVTAVTVAKTWDFESYTTGISLSGSTVYAATDGLYISGHNESAPAQVVAGSATGKLGESDVTATKCLYINGAQNGDLSSKSVNSYNQHAIGLKVGATGILYTLISGATKDGEDRYFNIYVNGVKSQTKITGTDPVVVSQAVTSADASVFISVSGGYVKLYAARFEPATVETVKIDDASEFSAVISGNEASVASVSIDEETSVITISGSVDGKDVTSIADNVFTAENTANVGAIDLSETKINLTGERGEIPALKNINSATLVYVPSTASVTGTNVVTSSGACTDYQVFDSQLSNGKPCEVPKTFTADKATLNRTFTASQKCTVCLPYSFARTGGKFYKFVGISGGKVQMAEQTTDMLEANTPYIFEPSANADGITTNTGTIAVSISDAPNTEVSSASFTFKGTYEKIEWTNPTGIYGFAAEDKDGATVGSFVRVGTGASIMACRAYLEYTGTAPINGVAATRGMTDSLPATLEIEWIPAEKGSTTGINRTELQNDDDAPVYSITGQRVDSSYKGLVIKNGKKVVRK